MLGCNRTCFRSNSAWAAILENWKFGQEEVTIRILIIEYREDRVTNTRYNETDFKTGIGYSNSSFSSVLRYNYNKLDLGIPEDGSTANVY
jgi:hypothetical protein